MENSLQIKNLYGVCCYEKDNVAYLRLEDVARGLGFTQTQNKKGVEYTSIRWETVNRYLKEAGFPTKMGKDDYIPENVFYRLAMKAKNETAEKFQALVADEIIPSVRKHGVYATNDFVEQALNDPDFAISMLQQLKRERQEKALLEQKVESQNKQIEIMSPKASYYDAVLNSKGLVPITEIAKDYGMGGKTLNKILHDKKVQYKVNDTWVLYSEYAKKGYTGTKTAMFGSSEGVTYTKESTYWTQKGRLFIYELLKKDGKLPIIEIENQ